MNDEEKRAIEYLDKYTKWETYGERNLEKDIMTALNLIEKLQKENEELKEELETEQNERLLCHIREKQMIPVQKVKDKIEELNNISNAEKLEDTMIGGNYTITELVQYVLQELIEEKEEEHEENI